MKKIVRCVAAVLAMSLLLCGCGGPSAKDIENVQVKSGKVENGVYTNEYTGVRFAPGDDWVMLGVEDLQDELEDVDKLLEGTAAGEAIEGLDQFMDMQAADSTGLSSVNVVYTKMNIVELGRYMTMDEDAIIEEALGQLDTMKDSYAAAGMEVESMEKHTVTFAGQDRVGIKIVGSVQGTPCYMLQVIDCQKGVYNVTVTMTTVLEDGTEELAQMFTGLNA